MQGERERPDGVFQKQTNKKNPVNIAKGDTWNQNLYLYLLKYIALGYFQSNIYSFKEFKS